MSTTLTQVTEGHPSYVKYLLVWAAGGEFGLTEDRARATLAAWRGRGSLQGTLEAGDVKFCDNFGYTATITHYNGRQPLLPATPERG